MRLEFLREGWGVGGSWILWYILHSFERSRSYVHSHDAPIGLGDPPPLPNQPPRTIPDSYHNISAHGPPTKNPGWVSCAQKSPQGHAPALFNSLSLPPQRLRYLGGFSSNLPKGGPPPLPPRGAARGQDHVVGPLRPFGFPPSRPPAYRRHVRPSPQVGVHKNNKGELMNNKRITQEKQRNNKLFWGARPRGGGGGRPTPIAGFFKGIWPTKDI